MTEPYAPFPEQGLEALAKYHEDVASNIQSAFVAGLHIDRAAVCRNALLSFSALRDRCLVAEMDRDQAQRKAS